MSQIIKEIGFMFMMYALRFDISLQAQSGPVSIGYGQSVPVRKLAEKFGQGDLPVKEFTPGEAEDNVADISIMASIGWMPTISVLDSVDVDL